MAKNFKTLPSGLQYRQDWDGDGCVEMRGCKTLKRYHQLCEERDNIDCYKHNCFFAFSEEQYNRGKARIRPLKEGEKIYSVGAGMYGTKEGVASFFAEVKSFDQRIKEECDPQEVYFYEYNNHECMLSWDGDEEPVKLVVGIWGTDVLNTLVRLN